MRLVVYEFCWPLSSLSLPLSHRRLIICTCFLLVLHAYLVPTLHSLHDDPSIRAAMRSEVCLVSIYPSIDLCVPMCWLCWEKDSVICTTLLDKQKQQASTQMSPWDIRGMIWFPSTDDHHDEWEFISGQCVECSVSDGDGQHGHCLREGLLLFVASTSTCFSSLSIRSPNYWLHGWTNLPM